MTNKGDYFVVSGRLLQEVETYDVLMPHLTLYERTKILSLRASAEIKDVYAIAKAELEARRLARWRL